MFKVLLATLLMPIGKIPNYKAELLARTNGTSTYNLPLASSLNSVSPSINEHGDVSFKVNSIIDADDQGWRSAIWFKSHKDIDGKIVFWGPRQKAISDTFITSNGEIVFSVYDEFKSEGLFSYNYSSQNTRVVYSDSKIQSFFNPQSFGNGVYVFRSTNLDNVRSYFEYENEHLVTVLSETQGQAFLFSPQVNQRGQWIFKVRLGDRDQIADSSPDQIVKLSPSFNMFGQKTYLSEVIATDRDADGLSLYNGFDNSPALAPNGSVVFVATLASKKRAIVAVKDHQYFEVLVEGDQQVSEIELFSPQINDNGLIVFRAKDKLGRRGVYLAHAFVRSEIKKVFAEGDAIESDIGTAAILWREGFPGLSGNVDINNQNEIVFSVVLSSPNQKLIYGTAVYKLHPL